METLPDLNDLPDDLGELSALFAAVTARCEALAAAQPDAYSVVGGEVVLTFTPPEQHAELNAGRAVAREIAVKVSRVRLSAGS